ncbi:MAG: hypothetical protein F4121_10785 [Acidimicrobiia bacterium]|nr:hypothetical protein [Acidimicrobiia bacterium]MYC46018.1 hypothetical protein [Acidimicrobiia bacterium]MYI20529.1 hypothetical protein [Acidimicrobiia bacterium]
MDREERRRRRREQNEREVDRIMRKAELARAAWNPDLDESRLPPYTDLGFDEEIRPVVIVGLPGPWYLAKRLIGVYLVLLAITVGVAIVFALSIASCTALNSLAM